jgi:hypothetical protein
MFSYTMLLCVLIHSNVNVKFEAMNKEVFKILEDISNLNVDIETGWNKLLSLHLVMLSKTLEEAENEAIKLDDGKSGHSLGTSQGFESGSDWVVERIKEKLHSV